METNKENAAGAKPTIAAGAAQNSKPSMSATVAPGAPPLDEGGYAVRLISAINVGTSEKSGTNSKTGKPFKTKQNDVVLGFEVPGETKEFKEGDGEKPYFVSATFNMTMGTLAKLRDFVEMWKGKPFTKDENERIAEVGYDVSSLLGWYGWATISHYESKGNKYAQIDSLIPLPKGLTILPQVNESRALFWYPELALYKRPTGNFENIDDSVKVFKGADAISQLSEKMQKKIFATDEYKNVSGGLQMAAAASESTDPFEGDAGAADEASPF